MQFIYKWQKFIHFEFIAGNSKIAKELQLVRTENNRVTAPLSITCDEVDEIDLHGIFAVVFFQSLLQIGNPIPDVEITYDLDITLENVLR